MNHTQFSVAYNEYLDCCCPVCIQDVFNIQHVHYSIGEWYINNEADNPFFLMKDYLLLGI